MPQYFGTNGVRATFDVLNPLLAKRIAAAVGIYFKQTAVEGGERSEPEPSTARASLREQRTSPAYRAEEKKEPRTAVEGGERSEPEPSTASASSGKHTNSAAHQPKNTLVLVGRDHRLTSPVLAEAVVAGLRSVGCNVIDLGILPAPVAEWAVKHLQAAGVIVVTASHNPPEWNGLKVTGGDGIPISKERGEAIEALMDKKTRGNGSYAKYDVLDEYLVALEKQVDGAAIKKRKLKLVLDFGNGTVALAEKLFRSWNCELVSLNAHLDGRFPGRPSEPTERNVGDLIASVKATHADAGIAWDGDGDRVIFVDGNGEYVIGDRVFALCILWTLKNKSAIVTTVATSRLIEDMAKRLGAKTTYTKIGAPYLSEAIAKGNAGMGGEEVGGVIFPEFSLAKDGIHVAAKLCEALTKKPLSEWAKQLPVYHTEKQKVEANETEKQKIIEKMRTYAEKHKFNFIDIDGIRIDFEDAWLIVRASGTENYVRIFAEAKSAAHAKKLVHEYVEFVQQWK